MKRIVSLLMAVVLLVGMAGCIRTSQTPEDPVTSGGDYVPLEPLTYTALPTDLTAEKLGSLGREVITAEGGLYYKEGDLYGIMTLDGRVDSGAIYTYCQPKDGYFVVAKSTASDSEDVTAANTAGLVDATGRVLIPLQYASVELLGDRFARVAELTGSTENEEEKLSQVTVDEETVLYKGNWYLYDLQTGEKVPGATGTKPYISFDCGGYVKYVLDDKTVVTATADGKALPEDLVHLKNGHYAVSSESAVYDSDGNRLFEYDEYVPEDSEYVSGYIVAKKTVSDKETYALLDETGKVVSAEFDQRPYVYGELLFVGNQLVTFDGKPVVEGQFKHLYWESVYGQCWVLYDGTTYKAVDKDGNVLYENEADDSKMDTTQMMCYIQNESERKYYSVVDKDYTIEGVGVAPFIVKRPLGESAYELVNVLTGQVILSGALDYKVAIDGSILYVYAKTGEGSADIYAVR